MEPENKYRYPAVVLAGGQSRRMGSPKALSDAGGIPMICRAVEQLNSFSPLYISVKKPGILTECISSRSLIILEDRHPEYTPIAGIASALQTCREQGESQWILVTCCDLFFSPASLLDILAEAVVSCGESRGVVFHDGKNITPFPGLYHTDSLPLWEDALARREFRILDLVRSIEGLRVITGRQLDQRYPGWCLQNINTRNELNEYNSRL